MSERLEQAIKWARKKHKGSYRDGEDPLPYFTHPMEVLTVLRYEAGVTDEDALIAAVLHDIVEDTSGTLADIQARFGPVVAGLVKELTRTEPTAEEREGLGADELRSLRSNMLLSEISDMSPMAQRIKLCDRLSNLRCARATRKGDALQRYVEQTRAILDIVPRDVSPRVWDQVDELSARMPVGARKYAKDLDWAGRDR
jgi:(p)ppGpp synthase/HD superfamily hydrolase